MSEPGPELAPSPAPPSPAGRARRSASGFCKATFVGGVLFLIPLAIVLVVLKHAMGMARRVAEPIAAVVPGKSVLGFGVATILSVLLLLAVAFTAGLIARTDLGRRLREWFEQSVLGGLPQYQMLKSMAEGLSKVESSNQLKPALISIEGGWQVGYMLEVLHDGWVAVFLPQAPTPMSGNVMFMPADRVRSLDLTMPEAMRLVRRLGLGSKKALERVDLKQPEGA